MTPGRTTRVAIIGHSLGASAVSYVQGIDSRVETTVAMDKLAATGGFAQDKTVTPKVPALGLQSEYGFNVAPYWAMGITPSPKDPSQAPDPKREEKTGFDGWRKAGVDSMVIVPRASTHLEYTDINFALPASRYGQDVASHYTQAWLDKYLKHDRTRRCAAAGHQLQIPRARRPGPLGPGDAEARRSPELLLLLGLRVPVGVRTAAREHRHR